MLATTRNSFALKYLEPSEVLGEILFGLIMVLTFTLGASLVVGEGEDAIREMLVGIVGCNLAWGLIDAGMYLMTRLFDRGRAARLKAAVKEAPDDRQALAIIDEWVEPHLTEITSPSVRSHLYDDMLRHLRQTELARPRITRADMFGAAASFWLVFVSTVPAILPFLVFDSRLVALRVSNALLLGLLFLVGFRLSRHINERPWITGLSLLACGCALVAVAMAFGG